jgi:hypothetical protein
MAVSYTAVEFRPALFETQAVIVLCSRWIRGRGPYLGRITMFEGGMDTAMHSGPLRGY